MMMSFGVLEGEASKRASVFVMMDPAAAVSLLNVYLDRMIAIAFAHHGTLDRIVGDAVAIMFSAPVRQVDHQQRAHDCALAMQRYATQYALDLQARGIPFGHTRIGVHCGEVIVGNFGGSTIFDYRALGDPVNTAARLESVNKHLGTRLCLSEDVLAGVPAAQVRRVGRLTLKGKSRSLLVYQPLNNGLPFDPSELEAVPAYEAAYDLMAHSDRGVQYASEHYQGLLARHGIVCSMSRRANCWDNAPMESFFNSMKNERTHGQRYATREEARQDTFEYIEVFYNRRRRHSALGYVSPAQRYAAWQNEQKLAA